MGGEKSIPIFIELIMPPAGLPTKGLKKTLCKIGFLAGRNS